MAAALEIEGRKRPKRRAARLRRPPPRDAEVLDIVAGPGWSKSMGRMIAASPIFFAQEVLTGAPEAPYYGRYLVGDHHLEWDQLVVAHDRVCVLAPRDHGKCLVAKEVLLLEDGSTCAVEEWRGGRLVVWDKEARSLTTAYAPPVRENGTRPVVKVTLRTGRHLTLTHNHPLLAWDGFKPAAKLQVGERVAIVREYPELGSQSVQSPWLIGALIGDGGLTGSGVAFTKRDALVIAALRGEAKARGWGVSDYGDFQYAIVNGPGRSRKDGPQEWLCTLGLMGCSSRSKRIPQAVFRAPNADVAECLAGMFDTDGDVNLHGGGALTFSSASEGLLRDAQHLLTRLGILAVLTSYVSQYEGMDYLSWRLTIRGRDALVFADRISLRGAKKKRLSKLVVLQRKKAACSGRTVDRFPKAVYDLLTHSEDWFRRHRLARPDKQHAPTRQKLETLAAHEPAVQAVLDEPVVWDEVVAVEFLEPAPTYSICVPEHQTFITANDVVNHNTWFFNFAVPLWKAVTMPGGIGFIFSATKDQAKEILEDIKTELETNPRLQHLVPVRKHKWRSDAIRLTNGHTIYARGYGTKVRGRHPHYIICDDVLNDETAYSELIRQKEKDYFFTAITNMILPDGQILVIGTPFHKLDLYADLSKNKQYVYRQYQALDKNDCPLWPDRYDKARLAERREEIGPIRFAREFQCNPVADDMSLFPSGLFIGDPVEQPTVCLGADKEYWDELGITAYMGVDVAMSASVRADYMVIWVMGTDAKGNRWIMDIDRERGVGFQDQLSRIVRLARKYDPALIFIEANQMQRVWGDELIRTTDLPVKKFVTTAQSKNALDKGVPGLRVLLENAKFRIPRGDRRSVELTDIWVEEMRSFTWHDGKLQSVGGYDDTVMAVWICDQAIRQGGFTFSFGDEEEDVSFDQLVREMTGEAEEDEEKTVTAEAEEKGASGNLVDDDWRRQGMSLPDILGVV